MVDIYAEYVRRKEDSMKMLQLLGLESIKLRHIPVKDAYRCYLQDAAYPIDKLALDVAA